MAKNECPCRVDNNNHKSNFNKYCNQKINKSNSNYKKSTQKQLKYLSILLVFVTLFLSDDHVAVVEGIHRRRGCHRWRRIWWGMWEGKEKKGVRVRDWVEMETNKWRENREKLRREMERKKETVGGEMERGGEKVWTSLNIQSNGSPVYNFNKLPYFCKLSY